MKSKAEQVLSMIRGNLSTNINNTNNTNNTNNLTTTIIVPKGNNGVANTTSSSSFGLASLSSSPCSDAVALPKEIHFESGSGLPAAWLNFKWDLFKNKTGLKLVCNIIKLDGSKQSLNASLNSPHDRLWRKVEDRTDNHWSLVQEQYDLWRAVLGKEVADFKASKLCLPGKKGSVEICVFFAETKTDYCVRMVYRGCLYDYAMPKDSINDLSVKQLTSNQVATLFVGRRAKQFVSLDELGI